MAEKRATTRARMSVDDRATDPERRQRIAQLAKTTIDGLLDEGDDPGPMKLLVHSEAGVGKTTLLAHCPGAIFLDVEQGAGQYRVPRWKRPIATLTDLHDALDFVLYGQHVFKAVVVETVDAVDKLVHDDIDERLRRNASEKKDAPRSITQLNEEEYGAGYDLLRAAWQAILDKLDEIRSTRGMHVLVSAHTKIATVPNVDGIEFKRYEPQVDGQKSAKLLQRWFSYILFLKTEVLLVQDEKRRTVSATGGRWMYCTPTARHVAKCRGLVPWPDRMPLDEDTGWSRFSRTATLIVEHGRDVAANLERMLPAAVARVRAEGDKTAEQRRDDATKIFREALERRDYFAAQRVLDRCEPEAMNGGGKTTTADSKSETVEETQANKET